MVSWTPRDNIERFNSLLVQAESSSTIVENNKQYLIMSGRKGKQKFKKRGLVRDLNPGPLAP